MDNFTFTIESFKNFKTVGSVIRSSRIVAKNMIREARLTQAKVVVELGPGDGVITKHILKKLPKDSKLILFEINKKFFKLLQRFRDDRLILIHDTAENIEDRLREIGISKVDYIISAIPFIVLPDKITHQIISSSRNVLQDEGKFIQLHYSRKLDSFYNNLFQNVKIKYVFWNIPPAHIYICQKKVL